MGAWIFAVVSSRNVRSRTVVAMLAILIRPGRVEKCVLATTWTTTKKLGTELVGKEKGG